MQQRLVVIGNGMASMRTIEELLSAAPDLYHITVFGNEPFGNYNRIMLSAVLCGEKTLDDIVINDHAWYQKHGICLHSGPDKAVVYIDRAQQRVYAQDGTCAAYDRLLIATGAKPIIPQLPGNDLDGVISFRDIADVNTMLSYCQTHQQAIVVGGGLLGLEAANGLALQGMQVTVIHNHASLLNKQLDNEASAMLRLALEQRGINFKLGVKTQTLLGNAEQHIQALRLQDGTELPCDLLVFATGITPNIHLAQQAGLYCERGIVVNDTTQTYDPSIYAVGECIQHRGATFGLVAPLFAQAKVCANHLSQHGVAEYITLPSATKLKVTGINLFSIGDFSGGPESEVIRFRDPELGFYKKLVLKNNQLIGAVLYGDTAEAAWYQELLEQQRNIANIRPQLAFGQACTQVAA